MTLERRGGGSYYYRKVRRGGGASRNTWVEPIWPTLGDLEETASFGRMRSGERSGGATDESRRSNIEWFDAVEAVARSALEASGYRRHNRANGGSDVSEPKLLPPRPKAP